MAIKEIALRDIIIALRDIMLVICVSKLLTPPPTAPLQGRGRGWGQYLPSTLLFTVTYFIFLASFSAFSCALAAFSAALWALACSFRSPGLEAAF